MNGTVQLENTVSMTALLIQNDMLFQSVLYCQMWSYLCTCVMCSKLSYECDDQYKLLDYQYWSSFLDHIILNFTYTTQRATHEEWTERQIHKIYPITRLKILHTYRYINIKTFIIYTFDILLGRSSISYYAPAPQGGRGH